MKKDEKILLEIYKRTYAASTPPADFEKLTEEATLNEFHQKIIPFMDYEIEDKVAESIMDGVLKEYKVPKYRHQIFKRTYWLGCSPKSKINQQ
jgi:hypothetical protein